MPNSSHTKKGVIVKGYLESLIPMKFMNNCSVDQCQTLCGRKRCT